MSTAVRPDWLSVAPVWQRDPEDKDIWRRVVVMPSLALNQAESELLGAVVGRKACVLGVGDGTAALALAAAGARVAAVDPTYCYLDILMVRTQLVGVQLDLIQTELVDLAALHDNSCNIAYAAQAAARISDLGRFYRSVYRVLGPGGRFVINEYHPFRRIWKQEPGHPRVQYSYFERRRERYDDGQCDPVSGAVALAGPEYGWTVSDHFHYLTAAGFQVVALEEVGDVKESWEVPNLKGLPEQLILAADRP